MLSISRLAVLAACCASLSVPAAALAGADQPFPASFWSAPLRSDAPLAASSSSMIADLAARATRTASFGVRQWNARIYRVGVDQPGVRVIVDGTSNAHRVLQASLAAEGGVPIPAGAQPSSMPPGPSPDTDSEIVVYQRGWSDGSGRGTGRAWEFWRASSPQQNAPGAPALPWGAPSHGDSEWHVSWGGRISYTSTSPGHPVDRDVAAPTLEERIATAGTDPAFEVSGWLATATSLPLLGGMVTFDDWQRGSIDHVIGLAVPRDAIPPGVHAWPAQRTDGRGAGGLLPEGTRLRLPPGFPVDPDAPKLIQMMVRAARDYGFVIWDGGSGVGIRFEQQQTGSPQGACPSPVTCSNAWLQPGGPFYAGGRFVYPVDMAKRFPWGALNVLAGGPPAAAARRVAAAAPRPAAKRR